MRLVTKNNLCGIYHNRYRFWFDLVRFTVGILLNFHDCICLIDEQIENSSFIFLGSK